MRFQPDVPVTDAVPRRNFPHGPATIDWYWRPRHGHSNGVPRAGWNFKCPYGQPGDRLWVREAWVADAQVNDIAPNGLSRGEAILYPADGSMRHTGCSMISLGKTRPSIHMPRWASRILVEITDVRVERLQDISNEQALAEGVKSTERDIDPDGNDYSPCELFGGLWTMLNGMESWNANPWVWVVEFKRVTS